VQETITSFIHVFCWRSVVFINLDGKRRIPRVSYFVPSGKIPKDPISNEEKKRREGSNAERTALGPDADLLPIPYPSIVELRWDEFSESPSQRPREREAPICSEDPRARARTSIHPSAHDRGESRFSEPCFEIRSGRKIDIVGRTYFT